VDVDHSHRERIEHLRAEQLHVSRHHDEVDVCELERLEDAVVVVVGVAVVRVEVDRRHARGPGALETVGVLAVGDDDSDLPGYRAGGAGIEDRLQVGPASRDKDSESDPLHVPSSACLPARSRHHSSDPLAQRDDDRLDSADG
jgi:hypothetical protein